MARKFLIFLAIGLLIAVLVGCEPASDQAPTQDEGSPPPALTSSTTGIPITGDDLANTKWRLVSFGEQGAETQVLEATEVTLEFEANGQAGGTAGCNPFGARYSAQDGRLTFEQFVITHTTCLVEDARQQESRYLQALDEADEFELSGDRLVIQYGDQAGVLSFVRFENQASPTPVSGS